MKRAGQILLGLWLGLLTIAVSALEIVQKTTAAKEFGSVELVLFFTTKCASCRAYLPTWNRLVEAAVREDLDVSFRAVSGELPQDIEIFLEEHPIAGEVVSDPGIDLPRAYGLHRLSVIAVVQWGQGVDILRPEELTLERLRSLAAGVAGAERSIIHDHEPQSSSSRP